jgi:hypothetical protein
LKNKDLGIKEIIENCKRLVDTSYSQANNPKEEDYDEYKLWRAYSWIEYCILLVRLHKYNLLDQPPAPSAYKPQTQITTTITNKKTKKTKVKFDEKVILKQINELLLTLNYKDEEKLIESLRQIRDMLKFIVKDRRKKKKQIEKQETE